MASNNVLRRDSLRFVLFGSLGFLFGLTGWSLYKSVVAPKPPVESQFAYDALLGPAVPSTLRLGPDQVMGLVVGMPKDSEIPEYLGVLQRRYVSKGLKVFVILPPQPKENVRAAAQEVGIPFIIDEDGSLQSFLHYSAEHTHGAVLVYTPDYRVRFHLLRVPDNDLVRQVVEKYLLGTINYSPQAVLAAVLVGRPVGGLRCGSENGIGSASTVMVVFPPGCSSCQINSYSSLVKRARKRMELNNQATARWLLVFPDGVDSRARTLAESLSFPQQDLCSAGTDFVLNPYSTRAQPLAEPLVLLTNAHYRIVEAFGLISLSEGERK